MNDEFQHEQRETDASMVMATIIMVAVFCSIAGCSIGVVIGKLWFGG